MADQCSVACFGHRYIETFESGFSDLKEVQLSFMQSDGGLAPTNRFSGHRAVLSGPAGGYVGYALTTKWHGYDANKLQLIGFDMGGTSTDVSRFAGSYEHVFESSLAGMHVCPRFHSSVCPFSVCLLGCRRSMHIFMHQMLLHCVCWQRHLSNSCQGLGKCHAQVLLLKSVHDGSLVCLRQHQQRGKSYPAAACIHSGLSSSHRSKHHSVSLAYYDKDRQAWRQLIAAVCP